MTEAHWEHFAHDADVGIHGVGATPARAFEQAALAMTAAITDPRTVAPEQLIEVSCEGPDIELLLVDWLNALVYEMGTRRMLFSRFEARVTDTQLLGKAWGEQVDVDKHHPVVEVKGATYTALGVYQSDDGDWHARCVIDV